MLGPLEAAARSVDTSRDGVRDGGRDGVEPQLELIELADPAPPPTPREDG
jgi:hypothetical protein